MKLNDPEITTASSSTITLLWAITSTILILYNSLADFEFRKALHPSSNPSIPRLLSNISIILENFLSHSTNRRTICLRLSYSLKFWIFVRFPNMNFPIWEVGKYRGKLEKAKIGFAGQLVNFIPQPSPKSLDTKPSSKSNLVLHLALSSDRECFLSFNPGVTIEPSIIPNATLFNQSAPRFSTVVYTVILARQPPKTTVIPPAGVWNAAWSRTKMAAKQRKPARALGMEGPLV